jgi:hypothetical protein
MEHVYNPEDLWVVAFIQDESTREVYHLLHLGKSSEFRRNQGSGPRSKFIVFPNPASERVIIRFEEPLMML